MDMEDNIKRYLEKIIKWFVDDTVIDYNHRLWLPTFLEHMTDFPVPLRPLDISRLSLYPLTRLYNHCRDTYGLNNDEINYIWGNYSTIIIDKINNKESINESVDNKKRYLDKVVDFLVEDTKVDYEYRMIFFPFTYKRSLRQGSNNLTPFHRLLFDTYIPIDGFMEYIDESFGITSEEGIVYVWESYKVIMRDIVFGNSTSPLYFNESVDSKKIYLDKIVQYIIDDTEIDYDEGEIKYPYYSNILLLHNHQLPFSVHSFRAFAIYCKNMYSLEDIEEIQYMWKQYRDILNNSGYSTKPINESVDRKNDYLDKIVNFLIEDTEYEIYVNRFSDHSETKVEIWYPSTGEDEAPYDYSIYDIYNWSDGEEWILSGGDDIDTVCSTYNICDTDTIQELYNRYIQKLSIIIIEEVELKNGDSINESVDRKDEYLNKIVEFLVTDTIINYNTDIIIFPFSSIGPSGRPLPSFLSDILSLMPLVSHLFHNYCRETYGLTDDEMVEVWDKYSKILTSKLNNKGSINESVDRRSVYLDKIVDFLVDDTEVGTGWFNPPYYIGNGRSTAGRTGFKSVYLHTFDLLDYTTYSGLDSQLIYFNSFCKNNYGLTGEETKIVWERYMKKLYESYDWGF